MEINVFTAKKRANDRRPEEVVQRSQFCARKESKGKKIDQGVSAVKQCIQELYYRHI